VGPATVVIEDGTIVEVGAVGAAGRTIDCAGKLVLPGLVNAHAHTTEVLYRGLGGGLDHLDWVLRKHALQNALDETGAQAGTALACLEMLRSGAVGFLDPEVEPRHFDGVARAADASGLRGCLSLAIQARHGYGVHGGGEGHEHGHGEDHGHHGDAQHGQGEAEGHGHGHGHGNDEAHGHADSPFDIRLPSTAGRVQAWLGPRSISALTRDLGAAVARSAQATGARLTFHCSEDTRDVEAVRAESGLTPARHAQQLGLLTDRAVLAHGVYLEPDDFPAIAEAGAHLAHCPVSNAKTGHGIAALATMQAAGINVAVGTDGGMSNDSYDLLLELRMIALVHRATARNPGATSPAQILTMATHNGARALGLPGGALQAGAAGDVVIVDLRALGTWPAHDPLDTLVFAGSRHVVDSVIVQGELLLEGGRPTRLDEARILAEAAQVARDTARAVGIDTWVPATGAGGRARPD
jgi:cytosine/adenosine deaminase-related metal-dependent hydrolase